MEENRRSLCLLNEMGDIEIEWEPQNDEVMRRIIQKKMDEGMKFFHYVTVAKKVKRRTIKDLKELKEMRVEVADEDIERAFTDGMVEFSRRGEGEEFQEITRVDNAAIAAQTNTVGVRQFQGG